MRVFWHGVRGDELHKALGEGLGSRSDYVRGFCRVPVDGEKYGGPLSATARRTA